MKSQITISMPADLLVELKARSAGRFGATSVIVKEALRTYFAATPMTDEQKQFLQIILNRDAAKNAPESQPHDQIGGGL